jgi:hypothetical protein
MISSIIWQKTKSKFGTAVALANRSSWKWWLVGVTAVLFCVVLKENTLEKCTPNTSEYEFFSNLIKPGVD